MARRAQAVGTPLVLTGRGQITLPKAVRDRLRLAGGSVLLLREENGRLVLDPAAVTPAETYTNAQIDAWVKADRLAGGSDAPSDGGGASDRSEWRPRLGLRCGFSSTPTCSLRQRR